MWKILDKRKGGKGVRSHFILDMGAKNDQIDLKIVRTIFPTHFKLDGFEKIHAMTENPCGRTKYFAYFHFAYFFKLLGLKANKVTFYLSQAY
jgi:hypothetical protein